MGDLLHYDAFCDDLLLSRDLKPGNIMKINPADANRNTLSTLHKVNALPARSRSLWAKKTDMPSKAEIGGQNDNSGVPISAVSATIEFKTAQGVQRRNSESTNPASTNAEKPNTVSTYQLLDLGSVSTVNDTDSALNAAILVQGSFVAVDGARDEFAGYVAIMPV